MKFIDQIVDIALKEHGDDTGNLTIVFPNIRSGLFFKKSLAARIDRPLWSPTVLSIVDFIKQASPFRTPDRLVLVFELYQVYKKLLKSSESFDRFFYWGEVLLKDFDELDKFMVDAGSLFQNLSLQKELADNLAFLSKEQQDLIKKFWKSFEGKLSPHQEQFVSVWELLHKIYREYRRVLAEKKMAYDGMAYSWVAEQLPAGQESPNQLGKKMALGPVIFAGFNALSTAEERIMTWLVEQKKATVIWDADDHYLKNDQQEAGFFMRQIMAKNPGLSKTFMDSYGNKFIKNPGLEITAVSVASNTGQVQAASQMLNDLAQNQSINENTALILPEEKLLFSALNALPENVGKLNITMGYPLKESLAFSFVDNLVQLHFSGMDVRKPAFYYRHVLDILQHPYIASLELGQANRAVRAIVDYNKLYVSGQSVHGDDVFLKEIFQPVTSVGQFIDYAQDLLATMEKSETDELEREFIFHFYTLFNQFKDFIETRKIQLSGQAFMKLFRQFLYSYRLPFEGEPLQGMQVMGLLETRNLDFDNIFILSVNEGLLPPSAGNGSFVPYNLRKAYGLPTADHQDAIYSYLFYRLVQRARRVFLFYNSKEGGDGAGEISRFGKQLEFETGIKIAYRTVNTEVAIEQPREISITKDQGVMERLRRYTRQQGRFDKYLTPSTLNTYFDCRLKFCYKYVFDIKEEDELQEDIDSRAFGNIFHHTVEMAYESIKNPGKPVRAEQLDDLGKSLDFFIEKAFKRHFGQEDERPFEFTGQHIIIREVIKKIALKVVEFDKQQTPFEILGLEVGENDGYLLALPIQNAIENLTVGIKGIIDRIDRKGDTVRILDYKTGQDNKVFEDVASLFDRDLKSRNKAAFQTFLYGLLFKAAHPVFEGKVQAGLFNVRELFNQDFNYLLRQKNGGRTAVNLEDIAPLLDEFSGRLTGLVEEIFDPEVPFNQTDDLKKCETCPYSGICRR